MEGESEQQGKVSTQKEGYVLVREGQGEIAFSVGKEVFYNPVQEVNRDLSIMVIKLFQEQLRGNSFSIILERSAEQPSDVGINILEALAATGLRSIRYMKEISGINSIIANDLDPAAVEAIRKNIEHNELDPTKVIPNQGDASLFMHQCLAEKKQFEVIDIDPYGSASPFMNAAVQSIKEGGLLCITCTDLAVLCGNHPESCWSKYGSMPLHKKYGHEMGIRIILASLERHANLHNRYIVPILSMNIDFYVRIFVRVFTSASEVKLSAVKVSSVFQCSSCESYWTQPLAKVITSKKGNQKFLPSALQLESNHCTECGKNLKIGGPIWSKSLSDQNWVQRILKHLEDSPNLYKQADKITGLLRVVKDELDQPLFYPLDRMCNTLRLSQPSMKEYRSALLNGGYKVSNSHTNPNAIKTDAPNSVVWDILRCWHKQKPAKNINQNSAAFPILSKEPSFQADFTLHKDAVLPKAPRFLPNPANWGPGTRAGKKRSNTKDNKRSKKMKTEENST